MTREMVKVSVYINEADEWHRRPMHGEVLRILREQGVSGATVLRGVAGYTATADADNRWLKEIVAKPPLVIEFIDDAEHAERVLPLIKQMVGSRLVVMQRVEVAD